MSECCWNSDSISWRKTLQIWHNFMQWLVVNTLFQEKKKHHNQKDGSKGTPKIGPVVEVATSYLHGNLELRSENFSWIKLVWDEFEKQWNRNLRSTARRMCVEIESEGFCKPIKGQSKTTVEKLPALPQEPYLLGKELGLILNQGNILSPNTMYRRK